MKEKDFSTINWMRTWHKWQFESIGIFIYFLVNIVDIAFYSFFAFVEAWIVTKFGGETVHVFVVWIGTLLAMGNCILRKLKNLPEDIELELKDEDPKII